MTLYEQMLRKLHQSTFKNEEQIDAIIAVKRFIDHHYASDINLDLLSEAQFISKYHLLRLFKKYYGLTPRQYLKDKRIKQSKEYLADGLSVSQTCYAVGFTSLGSFSALFKTKTGKTPAQFQKEQFSRNDFNSDS